MQIQPRGARSIQGQVHGLCDWDINEPARAHVTSEGVVVTTDDARHALLPWVGMQFGQNYVHDHQVTLLATLENGRKISFTAEGPDLGVQLARFAPAELQARLQDVGLVTAKARRQTRGFFATAVCLLVLLLSSLQWLPSLVALYFPPEWEAKVGQSAFQGQELGDPIVENAVQHIWDRLTPGLEPNPYTFHLKVVRSDQINAFAAPGGYVVVLSGLLTDIKRPEELAGVLAHESQHVIYRHTLKALVHSAEFDIILALFFHHHDNEELRRMGSSLGSLAYSRANEAQADAEGARALMRAHLDPTGLPDFFRRLEAEHPSRATALMADHPTNTDRIASLEAIIKAAPRQDWQPLDVDWKAVQKALAKDGLP